MLIKINMNFLFLASCWVQGFVSFILIKDVNPLNFLMNSSLHNISLDFFPQTLSVEVETERTFNFYLSEPPNETVFIYFLEDGIDKNIIKLSITNYTFEVGEVSGTNVTVFGQHAGHVDVTANTSDSYVDLFSAYISVQVFHSYILDIASDVIGWIYFFFWTVSFYPQIYENFKRKSVIGLNFDYLLLNFLGHNCYNFFNIGLFWIPTIQEEYFKAHPHGVNPVQLNDVGFSMHAVFATSVTIIQAFIYERGDQKVSFTCRSLFTIFMSIIVIALILSVEHVITWLDYLYYFSYIKLVITLLKCCPQAYLNYKRKSTVGWSIGNVLMDMIGGLLSILQMFLIAYNFNDWSSIFGDPTKFGLGLFSVLFDIVFIAQHYVLYRPKPNQLVESNSNSGPYENTCPSYENTCPSYDAISPPPYETTYPPSYDASGSRESLMRN